MANAHRGEVEIHLDRPRILRLDMNVLDEAEQVLGQDVGVALSVRGWSIGMLRTFLWAALRGGGNPDVERLGTREGLRLAGTLAESYQPDLPMVKKIPELRAVLIKTLNLYLYGSETPPKESGPEEETAATQPGTSSDRPSASPSAPADSKTQPSSGSSPSTN